MKKRFTLALKKIFSLLVFTAVQAKTWGMDTAANTDMDKPTNIFTQPWIWIGVIVITILVLIGPLNDNREYPVIMKKKTGNKKKMEQYIK